MSSIKNALRQFHNDEDGVEQMNVIMILAVAALVLMAIWVFWGQIKAWWEGIWADVQGDVKNP